MAKWNIEASVIVDLNMEVEADSRDEAERLFETHISVTANMVDLSSENFEVWDDNISEIADIQISIPA